MDTKVVFVMNPFEIVLTKAIFSTWPNLLNRLINGLKQTPWSKSDSILVPRILKLFLTALSIMVSWRSDLYRSTTREGHMVGRWISWPFLDLKTRGDTNSHLALARVLWRADIGPATLAGGPELFLR